MASQSTRLVDAAQAGNHGAVEQQVATILASSPAGAVQRHHLEVVTERRGAGGTRGGVAAVEEAVVVEEREQSVLAQRDLARLATRVLDDGDGIARLDLAWRREEPVMAELGEAPTTADRLRRDRYERNIEGLVAGIEQIGPEGERHPGVHLHRPVDAQVELGPCAFGPVGGGEDVLVGHHHPRRDHEAGRELRCAVQLDDDAAHGATGDEGAFQERHVDHVVGADRALLDLAGGHGRGHSDAGQIDRHGSVHLRPPRPPALGWRRRVCRVAQSLLGVCEELRAQLHLRLTSCRRSTRW